MGYTISSIARMNGRYYFTTKEMAGLFEYDSTKHGLTMVGIINNDYFTAESYCNTVCAVKNCIVIGPGKGDKFYLYKNGCIKELELPDELKVIMENSYKMVAIKFNCAHEYKGKAFFVGWSVNAVVEIDVDNETINAYALFEKNTEYLCMSAGRNGGKLLISSRIGNTIYEFDMETKQYKDLGIKTVSSSWGAEYGDDAIYSYAVRNPDVYIWKDSWKNALKEKTRSNIRRVIFCNGELWVFMEEDQRIIVISQSGEDTIYLDTCRKLTAVGVINEKEIWASDSSANTIFFIDTTKKTIIYNTLPVISNSEEFIKNVELKGLTLDEGVGIGLDTFIEMLGSK